MASELSLHLVKVIQVFRQLGRTPGGEGAGTAGELGALGDGDGAADEAGDDG